jgi:hypothetical protein
MKAKGWRLAAVFAVMLAPCSTTARAQAKPRLRVAVAPTMVAAGGTAVVRLSGIRGHRCTLSVRANGATIFRRTIRRSRRNVSIPATTRAGSGTARARCAGRSASKRFAITGRPAIPTLVTQTPVTDSPQRPAADEQGFVAGTTGSQEPAYTGGQLGGGEYANTRIADIALSQVGRNLYTPGPLDHGQCKQAVNDWVAAASGGTQRMGGDYHDNYARNGGVEVGRDAVVKGDIIQIDNPRDISNYYRGMHTAVVVSHSGGSNTFDVVDSNFHLDDVVRHHTWDPYAAATKYGLRVTIWRMGIVESAPNSTPNPMPVPSTPAPQPAPQRWGETTGGNASTWTNYTNAGGSQGPTIPAHATVQIGCKLQGFRVADDNTWWYRIVQSPWNGNYYVSADAFYNNGATAGSLHGTPFVDPAVRDC